MGIFKDLIKALIRHWLLTALGAFVAKGWIQQSDADAWLDPMVTTVLGAVVFVALYLWSARDKVKSWVFGKLALEAPANQSPQVIKRKIKAMSVREEIDKATEAAPSDVKPDAAN